MNNFGRLLVGLATCAALLAGRTATAAPPPATSLNTCQDKVRTEGKKLVQNTVAAVGTCLKLVSVDVIKNNVAVSSATATECVKQFRKIYDSRTGTANKSLKQAFRNAVDKKCVPGITVNVTHSLGDVTGKAAGLTEQIETMELDTWCKHFGGDGSIDTVAEWEDCIIASHECEAAAAIAAQYPRAPEWLTDVRTPMLAVPTPVADTGKDTDAVAGLDSVDAAIDSDGDDEPDITCGGATVCSPTCCYVENVPGPIGPETTCFEYMGPPALSNTFKANCVGGSVPGPPGVPGSQIFTALGAPCIAGPNFFIPCVGPPNKVVIPPDSSCP
jgi:hypothetical protein